MYSLIYWSIYRTRFSIRVFATIERGSMATTTTTPPAALPAKTFIRPPESLWQQTWRAFLQQRSAMLGLAIIVVLVLIAICAPLIAPYDPIHVLIGVEDVQKREPPCIHVFG